MPRAYKNTWDPNTYNYYDLTRGHKMKELRAEFKKMQKEASKRLGSLSRSKNETAKSIAERYSDILSVKPKNKRQMAKAIMATQKFLSLRSSKVTFIYATDRKILEALHDRGYDFITKNNLKKFGDFMTYMKDKKNLTIYDSERIMEFIREKKQVLVDVEEMKRQFLEWSEEND